MSKTLNLSVIAAALATIATEFTRLEGCFRTAAGGGEGTSSDAPAGGKKRAAVVEPPADEAGEHSEDDVREALKGLAGSKGKDVMLEALAAVGAGKLGDVDESQYGELMEKITELSEAEEKPAPVKGKATKPAAKTAKAKKGPTLEEVTEAAQALIKADKPAYLKITKKLGKPSEMEEDGYAAALEAYTEAMPEDDADLV